MRCGMASVAYHLPANRSPRHPARPGHPPPPPALTPTSLTRAPARCSPRLIPGSGDRHTGTLPARPPTPPRPGRGHGRPRQTARPPGPPGPARRPAAARCPCGRCGGYPFQVTDRRRGQARRLRQLLLGQLRPGPQLAQRSWHQVPAVLLADVPVRGPRYEPVARARWAAPGGWARSAVSDRAGSSTASNRSQDLRSAVRPAQRSLMPVSGRRCRVPSWAHGRHVTATAAEGADRLPGCWQRRGGRASCF